MILYQPMTYGCLVERPILCNLTHNLRGIFAKVVEFANEKQAGRFVGGVILFC